MRNPCRYEVRPVKPVPLMYAINLHVAYVATVSWVVKAKFTNVAGKWSNFQNYQENTTSFEEPYDYDSVMHYHQTAFTANGQPTIVPLKSTAIGQRKGLSPIDIRKINKAYEKQCALRKK